jgi:GntR family transcriptional regulator
MLRRSPTLTDQVKTYLRDKIIGDEYIDGRIPSETDLADVLGVSRTTIRDALSRLEMEGAIIRKQGAGTFVVEPVLQIKSRLEEIWSYEAVLRAHGYTPSTRLLNISERPLNSLLNGTSTANELDLPPDETVLVIEKLFLEDDNPVILTRNCIPIRLIVAPYDNEVFHRPVYEYLETIGRQRLAYYLSDLVPTIAREALAESLQITPGTPLLSFEEIGYNEDNEPILKAYSYFRDDLLRFRLLRRKG